MTASMVLAPPASASNINFSNNGVSTIPIKLDAEALQTAAGTLPLAIEVHAIADCTVPGNTHRYSMPTYSGAPSKGSNSGLDNQPTSGNSAKVQANTNRCSRQCMMPARIALRDNLAP